MFENPVDLAGRKWRFLGSSGQLGDRPRWDFETIDDGNTLNTIQLGGTTPSKLVLPVVPGASAPPVGQPGHELPGPTALRGEPSRTYQPATNGG